MVVFGGVMLLLSSHCLEAKLEAEISRKKKHPFERMHQKIVMEPKYYAFWR